MPLSAEITPPSVPWDRLQAWKLEEANHAGITETMRLDKPTLVAFVGDGTTGIMNPESIGNGVNARLRSYLASNNVDPGQCNLYVLVSPHCSQEDRKTHHIGYKTQPETFASPEATELVEHLLVIPDVTDPGADRGAALELLKEQMSKLNFFGYSYGALFTQMVRNALHNKLETRGYTPEERKEALECVAALNVGPICPVSNKAADFSQMFGVSKKDEKCKKLGNFERMNFTDISDYIDYRRMKDSVIVRTDGKRHIFALKFHADDPEIQFVFPPASVLKPDGDTTPQWAIEDGYQFSGAHALDRYMNVHQIFPSGADSVMSFQTDPCAHIHRKFLQLALESSHGRIRSGKAIVDAIETRDLPAAADIVRAMAKTNEVYHQMRAIIRKDEAPLTVPTAKH